jgi:hypothetical protein
VRLIDLPLWLRVVPRLGLSNVLRVASYRMALRTGVHPVRRLRGSQPVGPFYRAPVAGPVPVPATTRWDTTATLFGHESVTLPEGPPDWLSNPLTGLPIRGRDRPWWMIPDFDPEVGDIKLIWELSRMDWVLAFAQRARQGDRESLHRLDHWLSDWSERNPPYRGPNWKCGQEASIRVLHLALGALILGELRPLLPGLRDLVRLHLQRIAPTVQYAVGQDNNHGTSEAAALFVGGGWLAMNGVRAGTRWERIGRRLLEERVARLVGRQGTFSQYSLNYHRLLLDTLSVVEVWRRRLDRPDFSPRWRQRGAAAARWLHQVISAEAGDGPNVGANDGANLLPLSDSDYRDYRPSVQLGMALFAGSRAYAGEGAWNHGLAWLGVPVPQAAAPEPSSCVADDGGFAVLRRGAAMALLRYPRFRFRPSQADLLHLDLWIGGHNLLRDAGSFSYHTDPGWLRYFAGTASHNTVQFDDRDQMPRIGRFLFADWPAPFHLQPLTEDESGVSLAAGYRDRTGAVHKRWVRLSEDGSQVSDEVRGFSHKAILRWRLAPGSWQVERVSASGLRVTRSTSGGAELTVRSSALLRRGELVEGWESRYYMNKTASPVLEIEVGEAATLTTAIRWPHEALHRHRPD